jgi:glycosyltransferase involved in cell wall biosynthesis
MIENSGQKIRLAILGTRGIPANYGGFEKFAEELSIRLATLDIDVTVYCEDSGSQRDTMYNGVALRYESVIIGGPLSTVLFDISCLWSARKDFDIVYMLGYGAAPLCVIPKIFGTKVWLNVDGIEWARAKWGRLAKLYFKAMEYFSVRVPDRVIADAAEIRNHLERRHGKLTNCDVIAYGAPVVQNEPNKKILAEWALEPRGYHLVVCRLEPENHVLEIIKGYCQSSSQLPLIILGNHNSDTLYVQVIRQLASERVRFIGTVFDKERLDALRFHSLTYLHGHSVGGTNPSLLEAMGCGNIVIAHDNEFNKEVLGTFGRYFRAPSDIPKLISEIEALPENDQHELRSQVRERVSSVYSWDLIASQYLSLIQRDVSRLAHDESSVVGNVSDLRDEQNKK